MNPNTQVQNERKVKAQTMGSIMRHPKLSKQFTDALSAPIGSTKRKSAQTTLSVMNKVGGRNMPMPMMGGATGGPGVTVLPNASTTPYVPPTPPPVMGPPQNKLLFGAAPAPKLPGATIGKATPGSPTGTKPSLLMQGISGYYSNVRPVEKAALYGVAGAADYLGTNITEGLGKAGDYASRLVLPYNPSEKSMYEGYGKEFSDTWGGRKASDALSKAGWMNESSAQFQTPGQIHGDTAAQGLQQGTQGSTPPAATSTPGSTLPGAVLPDGAPTGPQNSGSQGSTPTQDSSSTTKSTTGVSTTSGVPGASSYGPKSVQDAVNKNMGPAAFAYNAMGDKELLKKLFPGVPEEQLPMGASLTQQVADLQGLVKKDLNMDTVENALANKIKTGVTLTDDLNSYIRGRDEVVNSLDGMITDLQDKMLSGGHSMRDPETANTMKTYGNYLYTLKGRASQRYVDFANQSINQYNSELQGLDGLYKNKMTEFETVYNQRAAITQETYNRTFSMLTDLYNNVEQAPAKELNMAVLRNQLTVSNNAIAEAAKGSVDFGMQNYSGDDYIKTANFYDKVMTDPETKGLAKTVSLDDFIIQAKGANLPMSAAVDTFVNKLAGELEKSSTNPKEFAQTLKYAKDNLSGDILNTLAQKYPNSSMTNAINSIYPKIQGSVANHILASNDVYRQALGNLTKGGWFGTSVKLKDKTKWMEDNSEAPQENLSHMYDSIKSSIESGTPTGGSIAASPALKGIEEALKQPDSEFASYVSNYLNPFGQ